MLLVFEIPMLRQEATVHYYKDGMHTTTTTTTIYIYVLIMEKIPILTPTRHADSRLPLTNPAFGHSLMTQMRFMTTSCMIKKYW